MCSTELEIFLTVDASYVHLDANIVIAVFSFGNFSDLSLLSSHHLEDGFLSKVSFRQFRVSINRTASAKCPCRTVYLNFARHEKLYRVEATGSNPVEVPKNLFSGYFAIP